MNIIQGSNEQVLHFFHGSVLVDSISPSYTAYIFHAVLLNNTSPADFMTQKYNRYNKQQIPVRLLVYFLCTRKLMV